VLLSGGKGGDETKSGTGRASTGGVRRENKITGSGFGIVRHAGEQSSCAERELNNLALKKGGRGGETKAMKFRSTGERLLMRGLETLATKKSKRTDGGGPMSNKKGASG